MKTQVSTLIRDVMIALNEVDPNEADFVGDKDNADLETRIKSKIVATVDAVHQQAAMQDLALDATLDICYDGESDEPWFRFKNSTGMLTILLKSHSEGYENHALGIDILRMVCARAKAWPFDVGNVVFPDDPLYEIVTDKYVGAQSDFPAVTQRKKQIAIDGHRVMMDTLELRCLDQQSDWAHVTVIPCAKIEEETVDIDSKMYDKVVTAIAEKVKENE
jgi:hypothetical protein